MEKIVIIGYGGHAKSVIDSIVADGVYEIIGYTDVEDRNAKDMPYLGTDDALKKIYDSGVCYAAFGIGYMGRSWTRFKVYHQVKEIGFHLPVISDPSAIIANSARIGEGTFVGKRAVINADASIGKMCIVNTGSIIEHGNIIKDYSHIAVGAVLCGDVVVGEHCLIGANSTILQGLSIGNDSIIGCGSIVLKDVESKVTRYGIIGKA